VQVQTQKVMICRKFGQRGFEIFNNTNEIIFFVTECINESFFCYRKHIKYIENQQTLSSKFVFYYVRTDEKLKRHFIYVLYNCTLWESSMLQGTYFI